MKADTPIALADITQMSPDEREYLIEQIRERRLKPVKAYEELTLMKAEARNEGLEQTHARQLEMFLKDLGRADRAMETLEKRTRKLRGLMMEIEEL